LNTKLLIAVAFLFLTAAISNAQGPNKNEASLKALIDQMTTAQSSYDTTTLESIFTADYIEISPVGEFDPRAKVIGFYGPEAKAAMNGMSVTAEEDFRSIRLYGDTAVVIAELSFLMSKDGKSAPPRKMMLTTVCRKEKGKWKIASTQYTGIRPPTAAASQPK
jgi:uncharacterized protein (TIGR02246 family)